MKKVAVLSCGRSDFSIYLPLLKQLENDSDFELTIIAFGSHTSHYHGYTLSQIQDYGFKRIIAIDALLSDDKMDSASISMGLTCIRMAELWRREQFDWLVALGDRYEMFSAVASSVPFNLKIAHLHGGEKTLGAIDNSFRHAITAMSQFHFVSCEEHKKRVQQIVEQEQEKNVFNVGSLALENLQSVDLLTISQFKDKFEVDLSIPTALLTYHPETVDLQVNDQNISELLSALDSMKEQILITLPNNDSMGAKAREAFLKYAQSSDKVFVFDFLGVQGYYSAMKHCSFMLGNSSSGIIEAATFGCHVINVGDRQKGRCSSDNVRHVTCTKDSILNARAEVTKLGKYDGSNIYYQPNTLNLMLEILLNN